MQYCTSVIITFKKLKKEHSKKDRKDGDEIIINVEYGKCFY